MVIKRSRSVLFIVLMKSGKLKRKQPSSQFQKSNFLKHEHKSQKLNKNISHTYQKAVIHSTKCKESILRNKVVYEIEYTKEVVGGSEDTTKKVQKTCPPARSSFRSLQG